MEKVLVVDPEKCTRCRICELICSFARRGEYNPKRSFIRVLSNKDMNINIPVLGVGCDLCGGEEKCVCSCPTGVLKFVSLEEAALLRKETKMGIFPAPRMGAQELGG